MDNEFASALARWQTFETVAGGAAATLLGLLFVSASIRPELFAKDTHPELLSVGEKSVGLLVLVILISLLSLIPDVTPTGMAISLAIAAILALYNTREQIVIVHQLTHEWGARFLLRRIFLPAAGYVLLLGVSISLYSGDTDRLTWLGALQILFLLTAAYNAWDLLMHVGQSSTGS